MKGRLLTVISRASAMKHGRENGADAAQRSMASSTEDWCLTARQLRIQHPSQTCFAGLDLDLDRFGSLHWALIRPSCGNHVERSSHASPAVRVSQLGRL